MGTRVEQNVDPQKPRSVMTLDLGRAGVLNWLTAPLHQKWEERTVQVRFLWSTFSHHQKTHQSSHQSAHQSGCQNNGKERSKNNGKERNNYCLHRQREKTKMCGNRKGSHDAKTDAKADAKKADNQKKLKQGRKEKATK